MYINPLSEEIDQNDSLTVSWRYWCSVGMFFLVLPFALQRTLATLRYASLFILCTMVYTISVTFNN